MSNIIEYVERNHASFAEKPLTRVDSLVFSWLAYLRIPESNPASLTPEGTSLAELAAPSNLLDLVAPLHDPWQSEALLKACAASPRFANVKVCLGVDEWSRTAEKQFCALTFKMAEGAYVAYRGTDDTIVGWKENFNMAFQTQTPAQAEATAYLERVARETEGPLWVGGHSKGGNLAVYAVQTCDALMRLRVERCFAHDAPGFTDQTAMQPGWGGADSLIDRTIPEESLVGLLLGNHGADPVIVRSTNPGILQHAAFSWVVDGEDFATAGALSYDSYRRNKRLHAWLSTLSNEERERWVEIFYKLVQAMGEVTFSGLVDSISNGSLQFALQRLDNLPVEDRDFFLEKSEDLVATLLLGAAPTNPETPTERADDAVDKVDDITARFNDRAAKLDKLLGL